MRFVGGNKKKSMRRDPATKLKKKASAAAAADNKKAAATATAPTATEDDDTETETPIYYFGYGAMVNPIARQRRGVNTDEAHAALLRNYRLTFSYGGAANIVQAQGYEVYGIVMKCSTQADWNLLKDFDAGYDCVEVDVFPLKQTDNTTDTQGRDCNFGQQEDDDSNSLASEEEGFAQVYETPIKARVFVLPKDQLTTASSSQDTPPKIPQERYLKVIASGMRAYGVDPDYINDEILGVEFIPSRKPHEYLTFPSAQDGHHDEIPTLSSVDVWNKEYQKLIHKDAQIQAKQNKKNHKTSPSPSALILFRLGQHVMRVTNPDMNNPFNIWVKDRLHGPQDSTWVIVQTLFDPDLPLIATPQEVTSVHQQWAENQMMEKFQQAGVQAATIYNVCLDTSSSSPSSSTTSPIQEHKPQHQKGGSSFQSFLRNSVRSLKSTKATSTTASQRTASNSLTGGGSHHHHQHNAPTSPAPSITSSTTSSKNNRLFRRLPKSKLTMSLRTKLLPTLRSNNSSSNHSATNASGDGGSHTTHPSRRSNKKKAGQQPSNSTTNNDENSATESIERCCEEPDTDDDDDLASPSVLAIHDGGGCCMHHGVDSSGEFHQCHLVHDHEEVDDIEDNDLSVVDGATKDYDHQPVMILNPINIDGISARSNVVNDDDDQEYDGTNGESLPPISCFAFATTTTTTTATAMITEEAKTRTSTTKATLA